MVYLLLQRPRQNLLALSSLYTFKCQFNFKITDLCESKQCESWEKCVYDSNTDSTKCVCREDSDCPAEFQPVCGSDAKRYNNYCIMKATACREGRSVNKAADGPCSPGVYNQLHDLFKLVSDCYYCHRLKTELLPLLGGAREGGCRSSLHGF